MTLYKDKDSGRGRGFLSRRGPWPQLLSPVTIVLISHCALFLLTYCYLATTSDRDPTSYFFDASTAYLRTYSARRIGEAEKYIQTASEHPRPLRDAGEPPRLCVGIATVQRRGEQYVDVTVGSLLAGLSDQERSEVYLNLLIGHTTPSEHSSFAHKWVDELPDRVLGYEHDEAVLGQLREWEEGGWYRNKTIYDYTYLLKNCYETGAKYVMMAEDDTLAAEGWYRRATHALDEVEMSMRARTENSRWIYLRLFYSDDLLGWNSEEWPSYLFWSFIIWAAVVGLLLTARRRAKRGSKLLTIPVIAAVAIFCVPTSILLYFMAGKQTVSPISSGVHIMNKYGCCSQAFIFPRSIIPDFLERTDLVTDWLVDMMIEKIADQEGWTRWVVVPPLLQHIGATSSKGYGFDDAAKLLWNFRFETDSPGLIR